MLLSGWMVVAEVWLGSSGGENYLIISCSQVFECSFESFIQDSSLFISQVCLFLFGCSLYDSSGRLGSSHH